MKLPARIAPSLLFVPYALAVWGTAYQGMRGSDELGLVCALLLLAGAFVLIYVGFLRRRLSTGLFSSLAVIVLALLGFALGSVSSGEAGVGVVAGLLLGSGAAVAMGMSASRRRRRPRTIFLSYRRDDSGDIAPQIRDGLARRFGAENMFMDVDSIELGERFKDVIADAVAHSDALVAVIGKEWLTLKDAAGRRRIDLDDDLVRFEIETALRSPKILVVPLAVKGARVPEARDLPPSIQDLAVRNGGVVRQPPDFDADIDRLTRGLEQGSIVPWSRAAPTPIRWRWILAFVASLLAPLVWLLLEEIAGDTRATHAATLSPTKAVIATAHGVGLRVKGRVRLWDAATGATLHTIQAGNAPAWSIAWSPDGTLLAFGDHYGAVTIVDANTQQERHRFTQHGGMVEQIAWSPRGDFVSTGDQRGRLRVWSAESGELRWTANPHSERIEMVQWSPTGDRIASAGWDRTVAVTDAATGELLLRIQGHTSHVNCVAWSADGQMLASGSLGSPYLLLWNSARPREVLELPGHSGPVDAVAWSPTEPLLATAARDRSARIWNSAGALQHVLEIGDSTVSPDLSWSRDGTLLAVTDAQNLSIWGSATGDLRHRIRAHPDDYEVRIVGWWPDARQIATAGSSDDTVRIWEVEKEREVGTLRVGVLRALMDKLF